MFVIDLKLALFVLLVCVAALLGAAWLLAARHTPRPARGELPDDLWEALPFGVVIYARQQMLLANRTGRRMLDALGPTAERVLETSGDSARNGLIAQPHPVRWWTMPLQHERVLLVLADGGEQQRLVQQQQAFVGQLAHELRTPLTALVAHAEIAHNPHTDASVRQASIETVRRETQRMARLMRDLLELHRLEIGGDLPLRPINLVLTAEDAVAQMIPRAEERGLSVTFDADTPLPPVLAHSDRLAQVFANLLDNAIKYCRPGDTIQVRLEARPDGVCCTVRDSGPGIPADALPHVTERLYRARHDIEGNGIGLTIVSEIVRYHHARLTIESATDGPDQGTRVSWVVSYAHH